MENLNYFFAAFAAIWIVVFAYILFIHNKQRRLQKQIDSLRESIEK